MTRGSPRAQRECPTACATDGHPCAANGRVDLYWLPLGAGGHSVRWNGRAYETVVARRHHRPIESLFHAALTVICEGETYVIEMAPVWNDPSPERGVVCEGPVGWPWLGRFSAFRYEVRCWAGGHIPDIGDAVDSPATVSRDVRQATGILDAVGKVPAFTWGRDELRCGDMWNSNSLIAWLLAVSGHDMPSIHAPAGGRAPGWLAGLTLAAHPAAVAGAPAGLSTVRPAGRRAPPSASSAARPSTTDRPG